jgi:hypothetical protein
VASEEEMARDEGGKEKEIVLAMIHFRVCTGRGYIYRDCGESQVRSPLGSQQLEAKT